MASQDTSLQNRTPESENFRRRWDIEIQDVSAAILRFGVIISVAVMLCGLALTFLRQPPTVDQMASVGFTTDFGRIVRDCLAADGPSLVELGILLLVLTPILRVAGSMVLFAAEERDWFYAAVTFLVLLLTLLSLLVLR